jgi:hypothetical protein
MAHEGLPHARCALGAVMHEHTGIRHGNVAGRVRVWAAMLPAHSDFPAAQQEAWVAGCPCCWARGQRQPSDYDTAPSHAMCYPSSGIAYLVMCIVISPHRLSDSDNSIPAR